MIRLQHVAKTYPGMERSLRGTKVAMKGPALWTRNLLRAVHLTSNRAPPVEALRDVTLEVRPGEIFGLVGRNGSGKTTLIKILAGLLAPTSGSGEVAGVPLECRARIRGQVSYLSTAGWMGLEWPLTAEENVRYFGVLCGLSRSEARAAAEQSLRDVGMHADRHKLPSELSNGMRQRVVLARALLLTTPLLLLDEPTVGLDPGNARAILELLRGPLRERGQTIVLADHRAVEMEAIADRIALLEDGRAARIGTPQALLEPLGDVTVIEVHTEEMEPPAAPPPPAVLDAQGEARPGPLELRVWRVRARRGDETLAAVVDWIAQPRGRIVFLAESRPRLRDLLEAPDRRTADRPEGA